MNHIITQLRERDRSSFIASLGHAGPSPPARLLWNFPLGSPHQQVQAHLLVVTPPSLTSLCWLCVHVPTVSPPPRPGIPVLGAVSPPQQGLELQQLHLQHHQSSAELSCTFFVSALKNVIVVIKPANE